MAFGISGSAQFDEQFAQLATADPKKHAKVARTLANLADNPNHPSLNSHHYETTVFADVTDAVIWESYVENNIPRAWRIWWCYGPGRGEITVLRVGPHSTRRER